MNLYRKDYVSLDEYFKIRESCEDLLEYIDGTVYMWHHHQLDINEYQVGFISNYMNYGVKEYWIINPMLNTVTVYSLNHEKMYEQHDMKTNVGIVSSSILEGFQVDLEYLLVHE